MLGSLPFTPMSRRFAFIDQGKPTLGHTARMLSEVGDKVSWWLKLEDVLVVDQKAANRRMLKS